MSDPKMIKEIMEAVSIPVRGFGRLGAVRTRRPCMVRPDTLSHRSWRSRASVISSRPRSSRRSAPTTSTSAPLLSLTHHLLPVLIHLAHRSEVLTPADPALHVDKHVSLE